MCYPDVRICIQEAGLGNATALADYKRVSTRR